MRHYGFVLAPLLLALLLAAGCAAKKDTRYLESAQIAPLTIPPELDTPDYNRTMVIPGIPDPILPRTADEVSDIEKPPSLFRNR